MGVVAWFVDTGGRFTGRSSVDVGAKLASASWGTTSVTDSTACPSAGLAGLMSSFAMLCLLSYALFPVLRSRERDDAEGVCQQHLAVHAGVSTEPHLTGIGVETVLSLHEHAVDASDGVALREVADDARLAVGADRGEVRVRVDRDAVEPVGAPAAALGVHSGAPVESTSVANLTNRLSETRNDMLARYCGGTA